ncbi:tetratricopeptide repeat protein [Paenibacillus massiliensis]|uniref:hypothetical protein n=1 Tax=Paenibacillus massiliensis TaxID=225917 RepID=UPI000377063B|nr:hypothetical protein [Paenibacillus massiliensis]
MKKITISIVIVLILLLAGGYWWWTKPYDLPAISSEASWESFQLDFAKEAQSYATAQQDTVERPQLPLQSVEEADQLFAYALTASRNKQLEQSEIVRYLKETVAYDPSNAAYSTALRLELMDTERSEEFVSFVEGLNAQDVPQLEIQKSMAIIDRLQDPSIGTAVLGQRSYVAIEILDRVLERNPYDWMAHYARGINNLYWPVGLQRIDLSIQDLSFCVAVARQYEGRSPELWTRAYLALGDALVKKGQIAEGIKIWEEGYEQYPENEELRNRVEAGEDQAEVIVSAERGMEQFERPAPDMTNLNVIWEQAESVETR